MATNQTYETIIFSLIAIAFLWEFVKGFAEAQYRKKMTEKVKPYEKFWGMSEAAWNSLGKIFIIPLAIHLVAYAFMVPMQMLNGSTGITIGMQIIAPILAWISYCVYNLYSMRKYKHKFVKRAIIVVSLVPALLIWLNFSWIL